MGARLIASVFFSNTAEIYAQLSLFNIKCLTFLMVRYVASGTRSI